MNTQVLGDLLDATERDADIAAASGVTPAQSAVYHHLNLATEDYFDRIRDDLDAARAAEQPSSLPRYQQVRETLAAWRAALARLDIIKKAGPRFCTERELCDAEAMEEHTEKLFHRALHAWFERGCKKNSKSALVTARLLFEHYWDALQEYKATCAAEKHGPGPFDPPRDDDTCNYARHQAALGADFAYWAWAMAYHMICKPKRRTTFEVLTDTYDDDE